MPGTHFCVQRELHIYLFPTRTGNRPHITKELRLPRLLSLGIRQKETRCPLNGVLEHCLTGPPKDMPLFDLLHTTDRGLYAVKL